MNFIFQSSFLHINEMNSILILFLLNSINLNRIPVNGFIIFFKMYFNEKIVQFQVEYDY